MRLHDILQCDQRPGIPLLLFLITVLTRIPFMSKMLYHMDSVQYALGMDNYNVGIHQPHPPGYFLYVMLGKCVNFFIHDANMALVMLSVLFSALTVVAVFLLGKKLFNSECALLAALFAITSPNLWFHGEVALSYVAEAFFSTLIAYFCWNVLKGRERHIWLAAIALAVAGGIRQNTPFFLFPLFLFCSRGVPLRKSIASIGVFVIVSLCWFVPMIRMTGGFVAYLSAFRELWLFNTGHNSVYEKGWAALSVYSQALSGFITCSIGGGVILLILSAYHIIRKRKIGVLNPTHCLFFSLWILPSFLFYLLIFIHPANPGYVLVFIPAMFVLLARTVIFLSAEMNSIIHRDISLPLTSFLVSVNLLIFLSSNYPVSYPTIRQHDKYLSGMLEDFKAFDPSTTALFAGPYIFYGFRQIMYYLPDYAVYQPDYRISPTGEIRKTFGGKNNRTFLATEIVLPKQIHTFATIVSDDYRDGKFDASGMTIRAVLPGTYIASGPITLVQKIYPLTRIKTVSTGQGNSLLAKAL